MTHKIIDIDTWSRKEHFEFFKEFDEPFFGITVSVDVTKAYMISSKINLSFYIYYMHCIASTVNSIAAFHYRIKDNYVIEYDTIDVSATVMRKDKTFGFSLIEYTPDLNKFAKNVKDEVERVQNTSRTFYTQF